MKTQNVISIMVVINLLAIIVMVCALLSFMQAREDIAKINKSQIERCYILECDIQPFGKVQCHQAGIDSSSLVSIINERPCEIISEDGGCLGFNYSLPPPKGFIKIELNYTAINDSLWRMT